MDSPQPPRKGRSRFSKALPAPPPLEAFSGSFDNLEHMFRPRTAASTSLANAVPTPPPKASQPPPPPTPLPLDSPLQRQLLVSPKTPRPSQPMVIPRRPVALPSSPASLPKTPSASSPRASPKPPTTTVPPAADDPARTTVGKLSSPSLSAPPAAPLDDQPPSPANSILSILSAYSRSSSESAAQRSSEATVSTKVSSFFVPQSPSSPTDAKEVVVSPFTLPPLNFGEPSGSGSMASFDQPPTPPMKDAGRTLPSLPPKDKDVARSGWSSSSPSQQPTSTAAQSPQSQDELELWKRRSAKTDKHIEVSELRLRSSHGSTAASELPVPPPKEERPEPPSKSQFLQTGSSSLAAAQQLSPGPLPTDLNSKRLPPRSPGGGLPGRNIRPNPSAETLTRNEDITMGSALSKAEAKLKHRRPGDGEQPTVNGSADVAKPRPDDDDTSRWQQPQAPSNPPAAKSPVAVQHPSTIRRLPTPDYEQHDIRSPGIEQVASPVSPVSPASSPDLVPHQPVPRKPLPSAVIPTEAAVVQRKGVPEPASTAPPASSNGEPDKMGGIFSSISKSPDARLKPKPSNATLAEQAVPSASAAAPPAAPTGLGVNQPLQPHYRSLLSPTVDVTPTNGGQAQFPTRTSSRGAEMPTSPTMRGAAEQPAVALDTESVSESIAEAYFSAPNSPTTLKAQPVPVSSQPAPPPPPQQQHQQQQYQQPSQDFRSSDGTIFKELVQTDDFDPAAARFPSMAAAIGPAPAAGTVFQMRGLKPSHWGCVHKHRFMAPTPNSNYPLACQTCAREDAEDRFRCRFCWLRVCVPCKEVLFQNKGDLGALVARIKEAGGQPVPSTMSVQKYGGAVPNGMPGSPVVIAPMSPQAAY